MGKSKLFLLKEPLIKKIFIVAWAIKIILINRVSVKNNFYCGLGKKKLFLLIALLLKIIFVAVRVSKNYSY